MRNQRAIRLTQLLLVAMLWMTSSIASAQSLPMREGAVTIPAVDPYCTPMEGGYPNLPSTAIDTTAFSSSPHLCTPVIATEDASVPSGVVDWVLVELRVAVRTGTNPNSDDASNPNEDTVVARKPAFLLANGRIVDAAEYAALETHDPAVCTALNEHANCPDLVFDQGDVTAALDANSDGNNDDLYLVIRHRNHLDIISNQPLTESSGVYPYDFTQNVSATRGEARGIKSLTGRIAMFSGDTDNNGQIDANDYTSGIATRLGESANYAGEDIDYNREIDDNDYTSRLAPNIGEGSLVVPR